MTDAEKAREEFSRTQKAIAAQWQNFATTVGKDAYEDLMNYIDSQREMYRKYGEEMVMPSPTGQGMVPIDLQTAAILLQNSRGLSIVKTYIQSRVDMDVAQPIITK